MSEEKDEIMKEETTAETHDIPQSRLTRQVVIGAIAAVGVFGLIGLTAWYFFSGGDEGRAVPAPRNVAVDKGQTGSQALASDQTITLTDEQLKAAGLEFAVLGESLDGGSSSSATTGVVRSNEYRETPVNSLVGGVVKDIYPELGQFVKRGQTVALISSDELSQSQSRYLSMKAELDEAQKRYDRALKLSGISEESRNELDKTSSGLRAAEAMMAETRSNYERSKKLLAIGAVSNREFEKVTTEFETAKANLMEAENRFGRAKKLLEIDPARNNELDQFLTKVRNMQADSAAQREKLLVLGLSAERISILKSSDQISAVLPITSPISGTLTERLINRGEVVTANSKIATVTDLSTVWVIGQVYEKDLGKLRTGSGASVRTDSYPGELFRGNISYVDPSLDTNTRTAQVRIELPNPNQKLKIGMYVNIAFATIGGSEKTTPLVPKVAVQTIGDRKVVFLATDDPNRFIVRQIRLGVEKGDSIPVIEGVFVGDRVVTNGSFLLRAEWQKVNPSGS